MYCVTILYVTQLHEEDERMTQIILVISPELYYFFLIFFNFLKIYLFIYLFILFVVNFVIHWNEKALGFWALKRFILNPPEVAVYNVPFREPLTQV